MSAPVTAPAPSANLSQVDGPAAAADLPVLADDSTGTAARQLPSIPEPAIAIADGSAIAKPAAAASDSPPATVPAVAAQPAAIPATVPPPRYRVSLPPSATLTYEVRYTTRGSITSGTSTVAWRNAADGYAIRGEVSKFGFTLSAFRSEGGIDDAGIAPILYAEKNARRAETNTHFLRDARQMISFSAATDSVALQPGAQDRASIPWQLAGIARGQRALLVPGTVLDVLVAGVRDAERWQIDVIGEETVDLDTGAARLWHLVRAPRSGSHDKRIDIWLAPDRQWYPVKLRYTEQNGDTLDLSLSALH